MVKRLQEILCNSSDKRLPGMRIDTHTISLSVLRQKNYDNISLCVFVSFPSQGDLANPA